jgi:hypothetical protein
MKFTSDIDYVERTNLVVSPDIVKGEPMLFSASLDFASKHGGQLTSHMLMAIKGSLSRDIITHATMGYHPVIDTKVVMLKRGWYPSIPGWHCDGVPRCTSSGQPDMSKLYEPVFHYIGSISSVSDLCPTELLNKEVDLNIDEHQVWKSADSEVRGLSGIENNILSLRSGSVVRFNRQTLHNCTPAHSSGWRFFFRLSFMGTPTRNEIRNQVQVYTDVNNGW